MQVWSPSYCDSVGLTNQFITYAHSLIHFMCRWLLKHCYATFCSCVSLHPSIHPSILCSHCRVTIWCSGVVGWSRSKLKLVGGWVHHSPAKIVKYQLKKSHRIGSLPELFTAVLTADLFFFFKSLTMRQNRILSPHLTHCAIKPQTTWV